MADLLTDEDFRKMKKAGKVVGDFFKLLKKFIKPGVSTKDINDYFNDYLSKFKDMKPAFLNYHGFPASACVSLNDEVVHGIPSPQAVIKKADIVKVDLGIKYQGLFVDSAYTYIVGHAHGLSKKLVNVTRKALYAGIKKALPGNTIGDIGQAIMKFVEKNGFSIVRQFIGHGIGHNLHQEPEVPNFGVAGQGYRLHPGMAIAIEPMVTAGGYKVKIDSNGWTARTVDSSLAAHFEHTVAITRRGPVILTV